MTDIAGLGDKSFNYLAGQGLKQAEKKYGIKGDVTVSKSDNDYRAEHHEVRPQGLRPRDRRRLPRGAGRRPGRQEVPEHQVRDHRRLDERQGAQGPQERRGPALQGVGGRATSSATSPACSRSRNAKGLNSAQRHLDASAASRSRRSTTTSPASRPAPRPPIPASSCSTATRATSSPRTSARASPSSRSHRARTSSSRSRASAASAPSTRRATRATGGSASTPTSRSRSAPSSCSPRPPRASTSRSSTSSARS